LVHTRAQISSNVDTGIKGSAQTLLKFGRAEGSINNKVTKEIKSLNDNYPTSDPALIKFRLIYLFCTMMNSSSDIPSQKKLDLYQSLQNQLLSPEMQKKEKKKSSVSSEKAIDKLQKSKSNNKEKTHIEETYSPSAGAAIPLNPTVTLKLDRNVAHLKVSFTYPISAKGPGTQLTVYSYQILNNVRHEDLQENVFTGYWKPGARGTFSIDVPSSYYDPTSGRELRFCVGEPKSCYPSENLLNGRKL